MDLIQICIPSRCSFFPKSLNLLHLKEIQTWIVFILFFFLHIDYTETITHMQGLNDINDVTLACQIGSGKHPKMVESAEPENVDGHVRYSMHLGTKIIFYSRPRHQFF